MAVAASISGSPRGGLLVTRCTPSPVRTPVSGLRERKLETARCRVHARRAAPRRDTLIGWCVGISMARIGLRYSTSRSLRPGSSVDAVPARPQTVCYAGAAGGSTGPRHLIFPTPFVRFLGVTGDPISCTNNLTLRCISALLHRFRIIRLSCPLFGFRCSPPPRGVNFLGLSPGGGPWWLSPWGWGPGRGLVPIGANLPHRCTAFRVGYRRGASSVEPPCRF
ncbi:hypothetical protein MBBA_0385 [Methanoculleus bourgensis]|jgi:hypothetical protein|nr:hypothetical protein MBBA_0385 [Methanoculleus bourgensis]